MKNVKNETLKKSLKKLTNGFIVGIILLILGIVCLFTSFYNTDKVKKDSIYLNDVITEQANKENVESYVEIKAKPIYFGKYTNETNYGYYVVDDNMYYYIVKLSQNEFDEMKDNDFEKNPIKVYGSTKAVNNDIKKTLMNNYNNGLDKEHQLTSDSFYDMFGGVYLDTSYENTLSIILLLAGIILNFSAVIYFILYIIRKIQVNKKLKKLKDGELEKIEKEIEEKDSFYYEKINLILTKNYIIRLKGGIDIVQYKDLIWIYEHRLRQYGITTMKSLIGMDSNFKYHTLAQTDGNTKKSTAILEEVAETIVNKKKDLLIGYTKENQQAIKEMKKNSK